MKNGIFHPQENALWVMKPLSKCKIFGVNYCDVDVICKVQTTWQVIIKRVNYAVELCWPRAASNYLSILRVVPISSKGFFGHFAAWFPLTTNLTLTDFPVTIQPLLKMIECRLSLFWTFQLSKKTKKKLFLGSNRKILHFVNFLEFFFEVWIGFEFYS